MNSQTGETKLHIAVKDGRAEEVEALLVRTSHISCLYRACNPRSYSCNVCNSLYEQWRQRNAVRRLLSARAAASYSLEPALNAHARCAGPGSQP